MQRARGAAALVRNKGSPGGNGGAQLCQRASGQLHKPRAARRPPDTGNADTARLTPVNRGQYWHFCQEWNELNIRQRVFSPGTRAYSWTYIDNPAAFFKKLSWEGVWPALSDHKAGESKEFNSRSVPGQAGVLLSDSPRSSTSKHAAQFQFFTHQQRDPEDPLHKPQQSSAKITAYSMNLHCNCTYKQHTRH